MNKPSTSQHRHKPVIALPPVMDRVSVVITSHNYGRFLAQAIRSVANQTLRPNEIVVIDDASDPDDKTREITIASQDVRYIRVDHRNCYLSRRAGLTATTSAIVMFLDADDYIGPNYLADCVLKMHEDERTGIVTSGLTLFGSTNQVLHHAECNLESTNWIHAGSIVRRSALSQSAAYDCDSQPTIDAHEDWFVWRRVVRAGWRVDRIEDASYFYRQHPGSMLAGTMRTGSYYARAALNAEPITLVVPICRERYATRLKQWIEQQKQVSELILIDSTDSVELRSNLKAWVASLPFASCRYVSLPPSNGLADADRAGQRSVYFAVQDIMPRIYRSLREATHEFIAIIEDDIIPPVDGIDRLLKSMDHDVAAVAGVVPSRFEAGRIIAGENFSITLPTGDRQKVQDVAFTGFGFIALRRSALLACPPLNAGPPSGNFDIEFARAIQKTGLRWLMDWSVQCGHGEIPAYNVHRE